MSVTVSGTVTGVVDEMTLYYEAAAPFYAGSSFSGSGLPFHNPGQAFDTNVNSGTVKVSEDGRFSVRLHRPNSYHTEIDQNRPVPPRVSFFWTSKGERRHKTVVLQESVVPYRSLRYPCGCFPDRSGELKPQYLQFIETGYGGESTA